MVIEHIRLNRVRCLNSVSLDLHSKFNIVYGANGSGKSSLLEAIQILSTGRSFRTRSIQKVIQNDSSDLWVHAKVQSKGRVNSLGILRDRNSGYQIKINNVSCTRLADLTALSPVLIVTPDFYDNIATSRSSRIKLLDWGLFHVEQSYLMVWREYEKVLKQRNSALKQIKLKQMSIKELGYWDELLIDRGNLLTQLRKNYTEKLAKIFQTVNRRMEPAFQQVELGFRQGWSKELDLGEALKQSLDRSVKLGSTSVGPHRSDLSLISEKSDFFDKASRGQQKLMVNALLIATVQLLKETVDKNCLVAIDDLPSELDPRNQSLLLEQLQLLSNTQILVTAISLDSLPESISGYNSKVFHVEHGQFQEC